MKPFGLVLSCTLLLGGSAGAWADTDGGFQGNDPAAYLENARAMNQDAVLIDAPELKGQKALRLRDDNELYAAFRPVAVEAGKSYTVSFRGKWANEETIETNPTLAASLEMTSEYFMQALPVLKIEFLDEKKEPLKQMILAALPYGSWHAYQQRFYAPAGAAFLRVNVKSGRNPGDFLLTNPQVSAQAADGLLLTFRQTDENVSGRAYGLLVDGACRKMSDGAVLVYSGTGLRTDIMPLKEAGAYRLSVKGAPGEQGKPHVTVIFYDAEGKSLKNPVGGDALAKPLTFTRPEQATGVQLVIANCWLDEVRLERAR